jgi:hypothetical protein
MTDGVDIHSIMLGDVNMVFFDFAGQEVYFQTHKLFFTQQSIYTLVYTPRGGAAAFNQLKLFIKLVRDQVPNAVFILVITRCNEPSHAVVVDAEMAELKSLTGNPNLIAQPVDCLDGTGFEDLKTLLVRVAQEEPLREFCVQEMPNPYNVLRGNLQLVAQDAGRFTLTVMEFLKLVVSAGFDADTLVPIGNTFQSWGLIYVLSDGEVVLQPQKLADVLACVITKT